MKAKYYKYLLHFKQPSGTSRGVLQQKETWFIEIENQGKKGIGECGILRGLSCDDREDYEEKLQWVCQNISKGKDFLWQEMIEFPSIQFGIEMAFLSLNSEKPFQLFPSNFTKGIDSIDINGLIWMGSEAFMMEQLKHKIEEGFNCVKLKIGAIDFDTEINILKHIRSQYNADQIEIRVDANGAFNANDALEKLHILSVYQIHSIEQPIKKNDHLNMAFLCKNSPIPIALDEELIGVFSVLDKEKLLQTIQPQYIILKPSFVGGFKGSQEWIDIAEKYKIGWWITSALESNVGLNAIAQWTYQLNTTMPQGLGTGSLFTNNIEAPLEVKQGKLWINPTKKWEI